MYTYTAHTVVCVLLLAIVLQVNCSHRKASNRPRDNHQDRQHRYGEVHGDTMRNNQHWQQHKEQLPGNEMDYEEEKSVPKFFTENSEKIHNSSLVGDKSYKLKEVNSETSTFKLDNNNKHKNINSNKYTPESDSNKKLLFSNRTISQSDNITAFHPKFKEDFPVSSENHGATSSSNDFSEEHSKLTGSSSESVADSNCATCRQREMDKNYRIMHFKQQILNTLQIRKLPNVTGVAKPKVPALAHLYDMDGEMMNDSPHRRKNGFSNPYRDDTYDDDFVVKTERVFTAAKEAPVATRLNLTDTLYFPPSVQLFTSKIKTAYLWLFIRKEKDAPASITVDRILPESLAENRALTKPMFAQKLAKDKASGWKRIDLRDTVRQWIRHPMTNFGLQVRALDTFGNNLIVLPSAKGDTDKGYEPWLDTKILEPRSNSRRRRSESLDCEDNPTESRCCRHPLIVGFAEFGWDWIIAPTHVKADYCTGECRLTMQESTPYSWVNQQMPGSSSCCTPIKLSPLPLLYFDESNNIVYQILQNMKVDKCACA